MFVCMYLCIFVFHIIICFYQFSSSSSFSILLSSLCVYFCINFENLLNFWLIAFYSRYFTVWRFTHYAHMGTYIFFCLINISFICHLFLYIHTYKYISIKLIDITTKNLLNLHTLYMYVYMYSYVCIYVFYLHTS